jgi:hypothetical protein
MRRNDGKPRCDCKIGKCWQEVLAEYRSGTPLIPLGKKYGIDPVNILRFFQLRGIDLRTHSQAAVLGLQMGRIVMTRKWKERAEADQRAYREYQDGLSLTIPNP